jgi:cardiolipin synthase A/B
MSLASRSHAGLHATRSAARRRTFPRLRMLALVALVLVIGVAGWLLVPPTRRPAYPPSAGAFSASESRELVHQAATTERLDAADLAVPFAPSRVASFELFVDGPSFYPRILDDIRAAQTSVHIVQYGFRPGQIGDQFALVLKEKARQGVAVRVIVDQLGSGIEVASRPLFDDLAANGVQVVRNDPFALDRDGPIGGPRPVDWRLDELAHLDHRKMFVIDGRIGWVGGAGIEDHFVNGWFHDAYARVEGEAVGQLQAIFLTSFRLLGGPLPTDPSELDRLLPPPTEPGQIRTTVLHNVPAAGHLANTDAIERLIDGAERRLDLICPYTADREMLERMMAAAQRGVKVRFVVPAESNVWATAAALDYWMPELQAAGIEVWEHPILAHAKVVLADDRVLIGTTNLDAWALYRNWETGLLFEDARVAETVRRDLFDRDVAVSRLADTRINPFRRAGGWLMATISPLL